MALTDWRDGRTRLVAFGVPQREETRGEKLGKRDGRSEISKERNPFVTENLARRVEEGRLVSI